MDLAAIDRIRRSQRARANTIAGSDAQDVVGQRRRSFGFRCVERIETGWRVKRVGGRIVGATPLAPVAADWTAVGADGRSVRCEVKMRSDDDDRLPFSAFAPHQRDRLTEHAKAGGLSLFAWVSRHGIAIVDWSQVSLKPHGSLRWDEMALYDVTRRA